MSSRSEQSPLSEPAPAARTVPEARLHEGLRRLANLDARICRAEEAGETAELEALRAERRELRETLGDAD